MNYTIKTLARASGVNTNTIRSWERRYGVLCPERSANGYRAYSEQDMDRLCLIASLVENGHAISRLAGLTGAELEALAGQWSPPREDTGISSELRSVLKTCIERGDVENFRTQVDRGLVNLAPEIVLEDVLAPTLRTIGEMWADGRIDIGLEHALSGIIRHHLMAFVSMLRSSGTGAAIVFTTLSGERHEIGALMAMYLAAASGFSCTYLGPDTPPADIVRSAHRFGAEAVAISSISTEDTASVVRQLEEIAAGLNPGIALWFGYGPYSDLDPSRLPERVEAVQDFASMQKCLDSLIL